MINELIVEISLLILSFLVGYFLQRFFSDLKKIKKEEPLQTSMTNALDDAVWRITLDELLEKIKDVRMGKRDAKDIYKDIERFKESLLVTMFTDVKGEVLSLNDKLLHNDAIIDNWKVTIQGCEVRSITDTVYLKLINNKTNYEYSLDLSEVKEKLIKI